jgi:hypothetical protein
MKRTLLAAILLSTLFLSHGAHSEKLYLPDSMTTNPEWYIKVTDWSVYATWSAVAIIHSVTIENTSDVEYKNVRVRVCYTSMSTGGAGNIVSQEVGVLPVTLPPRSKKTYLKQGVTLGAGSTFMNAVELQVLGATPVLNVSAGEETEG